MSGEMSGEMGAVGIIGLGKMGLPIARNLLEKGFDVVGFQRSGAAALVAAGGAAATSPADLAARCGVLLSILPDVGALEGVVLGERGTLRGLRPGTVHIEMSTLAVDDKARVRDVVRDRGGDLLDCPISGTPAMVAARAATTFASGEEEAVESVAAVLGAISGPWIYTGAFGTGAKMKYVANLLVAVHTAAAAEAVVLARRLGLDLGLVQSTLTGSIASSAILERRGPMMAERRWHPAPGPIATLHPILEQIARSAADAGLDLPVFGTTKRLFDEALSRGWDELDIAAVHDCLAEEADPGRAPDLPA
jgi:3-hydroxyisobutyrate dehydrogenase